MSRIARHISTSDPASDSIPDPVFRITRQINTPDGTSDGYRIHSSTATYTDTDHTCGSVGTGVSTGVRFGVISACFEPLYIQHHIPIRARAYNDLPKHTILLKTASNWGSGIPPNVPFLRLFWTSKMDPF